MVLRDKVVILKQVEVQDDYGGSQMNYVPVKRIYMQMSVYSSHKMRMVYKIDKVYHI